MKKLLLVLLFAGLTAPAFASDRQPDEVYDRVVKTRTLRCAYTIYPSFIEKDPNTGKMSGLFYDLTEELGRQLGLKIEWTDEVGTATLFESFKANRSDANCTGYFAAPFRVWGGDFARPMVYIPYNMYVRAGEQRFKAFDDFNAPGTVIAALDGELSQIITTERFPRARQISLPNLTPATDRLMMVATGKADATPMEASIGAGYMVQNPGKLKQFGATPLQVSASTIVIPHKEEALKAMLDTGITAMLDTGALQRIVKAHEKYPASFLLPAPSFQPEAPAK